MAVHGVGQLAAVVKRLGGTQTEGSADVFDDLRGDLREGREVMQVLKTLQQGRQTDPERGAA